MKIYTRKGDSGETGSLTDERVLKDNGRLEAIGAVDELNAFIGCAQSAETCQNISQILRRVQNELFVLGSNLAQTTDEPLANVPQLTGEHMRLLEVEIDRLASSLPLLTNFILPGGSEVTSMLHVARTVCRRAERRVVTLSREARISPICISYLNRLSDLLFVMARSQNQHIGHDDVIWDK